jgi:hypothetical protein
LAKLFSSKFEIVEDISDALFQAIDTTSSYKILLRDMEAYVEPFLENVVVRDMER